jgi:hypothetical protein
VCFILYVHLQHSFLSLNNKHLNEWSITLDVHVFCKNHKLFHALVFLERMMPYLPYESEQPYKVSFEFYIL